MLADVICQMPDSKRCIAKADSPYINRDFITDNPWVVKMTCPTQFLAVAVTALSVFAYGLSVCVCFQLVLLRYY